jgi:CHASE3 domain sensor protein
MLNRSFAERLSRSALFLRFPRIAGEAVAAFGLLVIASWHAHWLAVLQIVPGGAPMQYNTALCFVLSGAGLYLLTTRRPRLAALPGAVSAVLALLTLLEYLGAWNLKIDEMFLKPFFEAETAYPGRMAPLSTVCFILLGAGFVLNGAERPSARRCAAAGILACIVGVIALVAALGFAFGIEPAHSWGSYSKMALNTAVVFLVASAGVMCWSWQLAARINTSFLRRLPVIGSVTLMVMITFVAAVNIGELETATFWRRHTIQVILRAQAFEQNLTDMQRGIRGYTALGDESGLASYRSGVKLEAQLFNELADLTSDNPTQQHRLKQLSAAMDWVFSYDARALALYEKSGSRAVRDTDATGESRMVSGNARGLIRAFSQEEQRLLLLRDGAERVEARSNGRLLIFGSLLAAALLLLANYLVSREMGRRSRIEAERERLINDLKRALEEVRTLSGMIPICGWCKSIRTDQGYWQSVEQYVREHTEADFTHGICPVCAEKFKAEAVAAPRVARA